MQVELPGSFSLQKSWCQQGPVHLTLPYPKRSWKEQLLVCSSLGYAVCWLHPMMAHFTSSTYIYEYVILWFFYVQKIGLCAGHVSAFFWWFPTWANPRHRLTTCISLAAMYTIMAENGTLVLKFTVCSNNLDKDPAFLSKQKRPLFKGHSCSKTLPWIWYEF